MSHTTVYSPQGEMFEVNALNAHDLVTHVGWSYEAPAGGATKPEAAPEQTEETVTETTDDTPEEEAGTEADADADEDDAAEEEEQAAAPFTTEEQFAGLETKEDVIAYLATNFPDFKPHHLARRESLIAKAIELATA